MVVPGREQDDATMAAEIASALSNVLGFEPIVEGGRVSVAIPAIGETLRLSFHDIKRVTRSFAPTGDPALELVMIDGDGIDVRPLIILAQDVLFSPEDPVTVLQAPVPVMISNAPSLISYSQTVADAERFAAAAVNPGAKHDSGVEKTILRLGDVAGRCLLVRCAIAGAVRFGLRSLPAIAWWQQGWEAGWAGRDLPPFPRDPVWEHLARIAAGVTLTPAPSTAADRVDNESAVAAVTIADLDAVASRLSVARLDEEFLSIWKRWIPITPARFADLLLERLGGAHADVALHSGGTGSVDVVVRDAGDVQAVVQLRFDVEAREMHLDEIRIIEKARGTGIFQRLQYNIDQLALALGLDALKLMASGMGAYAFAAAVFPRDREWYAKVHSPTTGSAGSS